MKQVTIAALAGAVLLSAGAAHAEGDNINPEKLTAGATLTVPPYPGTFPKSLPPASISGTMPFAVPLPDIINTPLEIRPNFDYFSWESFIALSWPAAPGQRGVPDQPDNPSAFLNAKVGTPVVWGTYKDSFELFGQKTPSKWDSYAMDYNPCENSEAGAKTLIFSTMSDTPLMQTNQAFSFPLIDQRANYVYYDVRYNKAQYEFIRVDELYLLKNLQSKENAPYGLQMPMTTGKVLGSIMVKAAWRIKADNDDISRYYSVPARIYNPQTNACSPPRTVLLVGLHIAHKVDPFTEWVWSTFEQVDNVPADSDVVPKPQAPPDGYSFNNGTGVPETIGGYDYRPPLTPSASPKPVQVTRLNPIPSTPPGQSTRDFNTYYQNLLKGTVWQFYELIATQWPFNPGIGPDNPFQLMQNGGVYPQNAGTAFPVNGVVNTTMETYFQSNNDAAGAGGNSCMSCHYRAGQSDFSWGLNRRAH